MDSVIYKVIFRAHKQFTHLNLTLSFKNFNIENPIPIPANVIVQLKNLSETNHHIINFQNIEEVLIIGNPTTNYSFNYYLVILYTLKSDKKKKGYLIGNVKKLGDITVAVWPFNTQIKEITHDTVLETYNDIIKNPTKYSSVCIIS